MNTENNWTIIILAAGKGTRLKSPIPKPLVKLNGTPLIEPIILNASKLNLPTIIVISQYTEQIMDLYSQSNISYVNCEPLGTGYVAEQALKQVNTTNVIITHADDSFFYTEETLKRLMFEHQESNAGSTLGIYTINQDLPYAWVEHKNQELIKIHKAPSDLTRQAPKDVVCGLYAFKTDWVKKEITKLVPDAKNEIPLPGVFEFALENKEAVNVFKVPENEWHGINTPEELMAAQQIASSIKH